MAGPNVKEGLQSLRNDAGKVMSDLGALSKTFEVTARKTSVELGAGLQESLERKLKKVTETLLHLEEVLRTGAAKTHRHIISKPYPYILGSLGLGFFIGALTKRKKNLRDDGHEPRCP